MLARHQLLVFVAAAILAFWIHLSSRVVVTSDSMWTVPLSKSLLVDGDLWLDEYRKAAKRQGNYGLRRKRQGKVSHLYSFFPFGTSFLILPGVWLYEVNPESWCRLFPRLLCDGELSSNAKKIPLERIFSALFVALSGLALMVSAARVSSWRAALAAGVSFYFLSSAWSVVSRGLWQHSASVLMLAVVLLFATNQSARSWIGIPLGWGYLIRPTNALSCAVFSVLCGARHGWRSALFCILLMLIPISILLIWSFSNLGTILPPYYAGGRLRLGIHFFEAISANLVSPSRGLFIFTPVLLVLFNRQILNVLKEPLNKAVLFCVVAHLAIISAFPEWWAGHSFGPRYLADMLPYLFFLFAQVIDRLRVNGYRAKLLLGVVLLLSFQIHYRGANDLTLWLWNKHPVEITKDPGRVWNLADSQILKALKF